MSLARTRLASPRRGSRSGRRVHRQPCPLVLSSSRTRRDCSPRAAGTGTPGPCSTDRAVPSFEVALYARPMLPWACPLQRRPYTSTLIPAAELRAGIAASGHLREDAQLPRGGFERGLDSGARPPANRSLGTEVRDPGASSRLADCVARNGRTSKTVREERLLGPDFRVAPASRSIRASGVPSLPHGRRRLFAAPSGKGTSQDETEVAWKAQQVS